MSDGSGLIERFYKDVIEGGNLDLVDELALEGYADHEEALPGQPAGKDGVRFFVNAIRTAFPDIRVKAVEASVSEGNFL